MGVELRPSGLRVVEVSPGHHVDPLEPGPLGDLADGQAGELAEPGLGEGGLAGQRPPDRKGSELVPGSGTGTKGG